MYHKNTLFHCFKNCSKIRTVRILILYPPPPSRYDSLTITNNSSSLLPEVIISHGINTGLYSDPELFLREPSLTN
jgi:hypothetical protein